MNTVNLRAAYPNIHTFRLHWNTEVQPPGTIEQERFATNCMSSAPKVRAKKLLKQLIAEAPKDHPVFVSLYDETVGIRLGTIRGMNGKITRDWE